MALCGGHKGTMQPEDIRPLRERLGWSQQELARYLGVDQSSISRMERGQPPSGPVIRLLAALANASEGSYEVAKDRSS